MASVTIERAEPLDLVDEASRLLIQHWPAPCIHYTADYLRWQFLCPGAQPVVAIAARHEGRLIGLHAAMPRRLRAHRSYHETYLLSFLLADPGWRASHVPMGLYLGLLEIVKESGLPTIRFVRIGSPGRQSEGKGFPAPGFHASRIGPFAGYGYLPHPQAHPAGATVTETRDMEELLSAIDPGDDENAVWDAPDRRLLEHYMSDPRPRVACLLNDPDGSPAGAAMVVHAEIWTAQSVQRVALIDNLRLRRPSADALRALCDYASRRWAGSDVTATPVRLPNAWGIEPAALKAAGLRKASEGYIGFVAARDPEHPVLRIEGTNLEIA